MSRRAVATAAVVAWFVLLVAPAEGVAEGAWRVTGLVVDAEAGGPIAGARVSVDGASAVLSGDDGRFALALGTPPPWRVSVSAPGYEAGVELVTGPATELVLRMVWAGRDGTTVRAEGGAAASPASVRLGVRDLRAAPARTAEDLLRQVPGLTLVQHGSEGKGAQLFLRGFDAQHGADFALEVEGVPMNEWANVHALGYLDLGVVIPEVVSEVRLERGPFGLGAGPFAVAGHGGMRLGVPPAERGARVALTGGSTGRLGALAVWSGDDPARTAGDVDLVALAATLDAGFGEARSLRRVAFNARVRLLGERADGGRLDAVVLAGAAAFGLPGALRAEDVEEGRIDHLGAHDPAGKGRAERVILALRYSRVTSASTQDVRGYVGWRTLQLRENFTGFLADPVHGDRRAQRLGALSLGVVGRFELQVFPELAVEAVAGAGGDAFGQREDRIGRDLEVLGRRRELDGIQGMAHAGLGAIWRPSQAWRVEAALRGELLGAEVDDAIGDVVPRGAARAALLPRVSLAWTKPGGGLSLALRYGRGLRPPDARALSGFVVEDSSIGAPAVTPAGATAAMTVSDTVELGVALTPHAALGFRAALFGTWLARESVYDHVAGLSLDLHGTRRLGAELEARWRPVDGLALRGDIAVVDARFPGSGAPVPFVPPWVAALRADVALAPGIDAGFRLSVLGPRPLPHGARGGTQVMTDAVVSYARDGLEIGLALENLVGLRLREGEYHFASRWDEAAPPSRIPALHYSAGSPFQVRLTVGGRLRASPALLQDGWRVHEEVQVAARPVRVHEHVAVAVDGRARGARGVAGRVCGVERVALPDEAVEARGEPEAMSAAALPGVGHPVDAAAGGRRREADVEVDDGVAVPAVLVRAVVVDTPRAGAEDLPHGRRLRVADLGHHHRPILDGVEAEVALGGHDRHRGRREEGRGDVDRDLAVGADPADAHEPVALRPRHPHGAVVGPEDAGVGRVVEDGLGGRREGRAARHEAPPEDAAPLGARLAEVDERPGRVGDDRGAGERDSRLGREEGLLGGGHPRRDAATREVCAAAVRAARCAAADEGQGRERPEDAGVHHAWGFNHHRSNLRFVVKPRKCPALS